MSTTYMFEPEKTLAFSELITNIKTHVKLYKPEVLEEGDENPDVLLGKLIGSNFTLVHLDAAYDKKGPYILSAGDSCMHLGFTEDEDPRLCMATVYSRGRGFSLGAIETWLSANGAVSHDDETKTHDTCSREWEKICKIKKQKVPFYTVEFP